MLPTLLFVGFFKTVIILLIIFYGARLITRFLLPFFLQKTIKDMQNKMQQQMRDQQRQHKKEGEVTLEANQRNRNDGSQKGEYIDFEEVD